MICLHRSSKSGYYYFSLCGKAKNRQYWHWKGPRQAMRMKSEMLFRNHYKINHTHAHPKGVPLRSFSKTHISFDAISK